MDREIDIATKCAWRLQGGTTDGCVCMHMQHCTHAMGDRCARAMKETDGTELNELKGLVCV